MAAKATKGLQLVTIARRPTLRDGIPMVFAGQDEDENGEPLSEWLEDELIVPPLALDALRELEGPLAVIGEMKPTMALETMFTAIKKSLARNYRGVPDWLIRQTIDVANMELFMKALMDVNGLHRREYAEKKLRAATDLQTGS